MTEFYVNYTPDQIDALIREKMKIYPENFSLIKYHDIDWPSDHFITKAVADYMGHTNFKLRKYVAVHLGTDMYHFYNVIM